ncbi:hypothetical protein PV797_13330 [Clostridiaceae bacterium M8S5]|nr:hypothetical protein PV797_13330 [Clostridiaceae bacterium M8S5]
MQYELFVKKQRLNNMVNITSSLQEDCVQILSREIDKLIVVEQKKILGCILKKQKLVY